MSAAHPSAHAPRIVPSPADIPKGGPSLGDRAAAGFALMTAQVLVTRVTGILGNLILAKILATEHFGLFALATTVTTLAGIVQQIGVREVLIHRQSAFRIWASAAFWITAATGLLCGILIAALSPLAAHLYHDPKLIGLILVLSLSTPLANLTIVPEAKLQMDLRFRFLAGLALSTALGTTLLSIALALLGFGAYAFVLPLVIVNAARCIVMFGAAGFRPRPAPQLRRWRYLAGDSAWVFGANLGYTLILTGGSAVIGMRLDEHAAGVYDLANRLSIQAVVLLVTNLGAILLPSFSRLRDHPERQTSALLRSLRALGMIVVPMCALQAALAEPVLRLIYADKWAESILPLQLLCCGMSMRFLGAPSTALFQSQGRFRQFFVLALGSLLLFAVLLAAALSFFSAVIAVAATMALYMIISEPFALYLAIGRMGRGWGDVARVCLTPVAISGVACALGMLVASRLPSGPGGWRSWQDLLRAAVTCAVAAPIILAGSRWLMRDTWDDALSRLRPLLGGAPIIGRWLPAPREDIPS